MINLQIRKKSSEINPKLKEKLLVAYNSDSYLQEHYQEVKEGDLDGLIWHVAVFFSSNESHLDPNGNLKSLKHYEKWFKTNYKEPRYRPLQTKLVSEILSLSEKSLPISNETMLIPGESNEHLTTLVMLNVEFGLKNVLELGVFKGMTTIPLAESVSKIGGHLWSMDIDECKVAHELIKQNNLEKYWTFIQGDDTKTGIDWNVPIDHLYIDTLHTQKHLVKELELFEPHVTKNGFITIHDTISFKGMLRGILEYVKKSKMNFRFYNYIHCNGLAVIRKL